MGARVTQQYIETIVTERSPSTLVTQQYLEVIVAERSPSAMITQQYLEVIVVGWTPATGGARVQGPALQSMG